MKTYEDNLEKVRTAVINWQKLAPEAYPLTVVEVLMQFFRYTGADKDKKEWKYNHRRIYIERICITLISALTKAELEAAENFLNNIASAHV